MRLRTLTGLLAAALSLLAATLAPATAETYPSKPIRVIVPYAAGGSGDVVGRLIGVQLTEAWGQQVIIDNRPGANGMLGTEIAAKSPPNGYTLLLGTDIQFAIASALYPAMPYDPDKDFEPIALASFIEFVLAVPSSLGVNSLSELVALAKARSGQMNYASAGNGSTHHLAMEMLKSRAGIDITHVPYKGSGQALPDLVSGQVQMMYLGVAQTLQYIKSGQLKGLAVGSAKRLQATPDIPTLGETYPGFEANAWWGFFAPAGTPKEIVRSLSTAINKILNSPMVNERFSTQGLVPVGTTPEEFAARIRADREKWGRIIAQANIKLD